MMLPNAGTSRASATFSTRPVWVWYCPLKWISSGARIERTKATSSTRSTSVGKRVRDSETSSLIWTMSRSVGVHRVCLKSQVSIGLMAPPISMKMQ